MRAGGLFELSRIFPGRRNAPRKEREISRLISEQHCVSRVSGASERISLGAILHLSILKGSGTWLGGFEGKLASNCVTCGYTLRDRFVSHTSYTQKVGRVPFNLGEFKISESPPQFVKN